MKLQHLKDPRRLEVTLEDILARRDELIHAPVMVEIGGVEYGFPNTAETLRQMDEATDSILWICPTGACQTLSATDCQSVAAQVRVENRTRYDRISAAAAAFIDALPNVTGYDIEAENW